MMGAALPIEAEGVAPFDDATRERIRAALMRYKQREGIGLTLLRKRILRGGNAGPDVDLSISTLRRFLFGVHRTRPKDVALCQRFLITARMERERPHRHDEARAVEDALA